MATTNLSVNATIGGAGQVVPLVFDAKDLATVYATAFTNGLGLSPATFPTTPSPGTVPYLVVPNGYSVTGVISGAGYQDIVIGVTAQAVTVTGGGAPGGQVVIASDGGLDFTAPSGDSTSETILSGGGSNFISLLGNTGSNQVYISSGSNTIFAGSGATTIAAGTGANLITAGSGGTTVNVEGQDTVQLAGGTSSIVVGPAGGETDTASALVFGSSDPAVNSSIYFQGNGINPSTVNGGTSGSDTFYAGAGGGEFYAGSGGGSQLYAGAGAVTLAGGTAGGDTLYGGSSSNVQFQTTAGETAGDVVNTEASNATVIISGNADTVNAGSGNDTVVATTGVSVNGGSGSLFFLGFAGASTVSGGTGTDTVTLLFASGGYFQAGSGGGSQLNASQSLGAVTLVGGLTGGDTLFGGSGPNVLESLASETKGDFISTGSGSDTVNTFGSKDTVIAGTGQTEINASTSVSVVGGPGSLVFNGGSAASTVMAGAGDATISAGAGGGYFQGGLGSLYFIGGAASSTVIGGSGATTISAGAGGGNFQGGIGSLNFIGGSGASTVTGGTGSVFVFGMSGGNLYTAGAGGATFISGGAGDTLVAGAAADVFVGASSGNDLFSFVNEGANLSYSILNFAGGSGDTLLFANQSVEQAALSSYSTTTGSGVITLPDGTTITLLAYTGAIAGQTSHL